MSATPKLALMFPVKDEDVSVRLLGVRRGRAGDGGCTRLGMGRQTTVDQALIRGLVTAFRVFVPGLSSV
jgi:hypothetical protein